ncbi:hypothetical protein EV361DRAFT_920652 [Lentinula raphanica]|nr:hypothetical protein EV361DRAFT_920652 [Lentinula raphanica]
MDSKTFYKDGQRPGKLLFAGQRKFYFITFFSCTTRSLERTQSPTYLVRPHRAFKIQFPLYKIIMYLFTRFAIRDYVLFLGVTCVAFTTALPLSSNYTLIHRSSQHLASRNLKLIVHCYLIPEKPRPGKEQYYGRINYETAKKQAEAYIERMKPFFDDLGISPEITDFGSDKSLQDAYYEKSNQMVDVKLFISDTELEEPSVALQRNLIETGPNPAETTDSRCEQATLTYQAMWTPPSDHDFKPTFAGLRWPGFHMVTVNGNKLAVGGRPYPTLPEATSYPELTVRPLTSCKHSCPKLSNKRD